MALLTSKKLYKPLYTSLLITLLKCDSKDIGL